MSFASGDWCHSLDHGEPCRVIAVEDLWGIPTAQVWLSGSAPPRGVRAEVL